MRAARILLAALAALAIGAAYYASRHDGVRREARARAGATRIVFAYSPNQEEMLAKLIPRFDDAHMEADGRPVYVEGVSMSSGDVETKIAHGGFRPDAWAPASSLWGRLLNYERDRAYVADRNPSLARTPIVIAMWEPLARGLGWPRKPIGFADILRLATTQPDWLSYGKPTFGRFKLGHTNPDFSTSGLAFVAAQYFSSTGKREGLTVADVRRPDVRTTVRRIEQS